MYNFGGRAVSFCVSCYLLFTFHGLKVSGTGGVSRRGGKTGPLCSFIAYIYCWAREFKKIFLHGHKVTSDDDILFIYFVFLCVFLFEVY